MSDGPHKSLPMSQAWKRVAERGDNLTFTPDQIKRALEPALLRDCQAQMRPEFVDQFAKLCRFQENSLFKDSLGPDLQVLRKQATSELEALTIDFAIQISSSGCVGPDLDCRAVEETITVRAGRGIRQVEEHYHRRTNIARANDVRDRIDSVVTSDLKARVARSVLNRNDGQLATSPLRQRGLDDGVELK